MRHDIGKLTNVIGMGRPPERQDRSGQVALIPMKVQQSIFKFVTFQPVGHPKFKSTETFVAHCCTLDEVAS